jgi:hypothetical protein
MFLDIKKDLFKNGNDIDKFGAVQIGTILLVELENVGQMRVDLVADLTVMNEGIGCALDFPEGIF